MTTFKRVFIISILFILVFGSKQVLLAEQEPASDSVEENGFIKRVDLSHNYNLAYDNRVWQELPENIEMQNSYLNLTGNIDSLENDTESIEEYIPLISFRRLSFERQFAYQIVETEFEKTKENYYKNILEGTAMGNIEVEDIVEIEDGGFNRLELQFKYYVSRMILEDGSVNYKLLGFVYHPKIESDLLLVVSQAKNYEEIQQAINLVGKIRISEEVFTEEELKKMDEILEINRDYYEKNPPIFKRGSI